MKDMSSEERECQPPYRGLVRSSRLTRFQVRVRETDILVSAERWLKAEAVRSVVQARRQLENYIGSNPIFLHTLKPRLADEGAPSLVKEMADASWQAGVGPMAAVAGAIAEKVGRDLLPLSDEIIVENGGDLFIKAKSEKVVMVHCESSAFEEGIEIAIDPRETPLGICTSSGTLGHSLSFGRADGVTILARSSALADAMATAVGNMIQEVEDIERGISFCQRQKDVLGALIILKDHVGIWGNVRLLTL